MLVIWLSIVCPSSSRPKETERKQFCKTSVLQTPQCSSERWEWWETP